MRRILMLPVGLLILSVLITGCDNMADQRKLEAYEASKHLPGNMAAQHPPENTIPFQQEAMPESLRTGMIDGRFVGRIPLKIERQDLLKGKMLFESYCASCHGFSGHGDGLVVRRGFPAPPSFHTDRLRQAPAGYIYTVVNRGYGVMLPYGARMPEEDRWRIIAYIRTLQLSQHARAADLPESMHDKRQQEEDLP